MLINWWTDDVFIQNILTMSISYTWKLDPNWIKEINDQEVRSTTKQNRVERMIIRWEKKSLHEWLANEWGQ